MAHGRRALLLRHDADLLRQRGAAPRARVHDDRRRRPGAPPPPARRGRVLPHRHRRARRAGRRRGQGAGRRAQGARRPQRRALPGARPRGSTPPTTSSSAPRDPEHGSAGAGGPAARLRQRLRLRGPLRGLVLPALRRLQGRERDRGGQPLPDPPDRRSSATARRTGSSLSSAFQERLEQLYADHPDFVAPRVRYNEALSFIKSGLQDISLSRAQLTWGVPVPWDPSHVFYVWFDALLNYYTALGFARDGEDLTDRFWPATCHLIGKDILKFHTVFWPAMLMAADLPLPEQVFVHGYLLDGRREDDQVARQRPRPVRGHRPLRDRRAALLPAARRHLRRGRLGLDRRPSRRATRPSSPTSSATSPAARWR